jgi:uncharacterized damage-inducible protein DinB
VSLPFPQPTIAISSRTDVLLGYLDYFRATLIAKIAALPADARSSSGLPSGWTPLELLNHLTHVERRWLEWGFEGRDVGDPWSDRTDGRWRAPDGITFDDLTAAAHAQAAVSRSIALAHPLEAPGVPGPRWDGDDPATLERVLLHLVQEYARHVGQLDIVLELATGAVGE